MLFFFKNTYILLKIKINKKKIHICFFSLCCALYYYYFMAARALDIYINSASSCVIILLCIFLYCPIYTYMFDK